jgi:Formyl transferase
MMQRLLLLTPADGEMLARLKAAFAGHAEVRVVRDRDALAAATIDEDTSLLAFGTGVIVPADILRRLKRPAYNVHAASPEFPGRDPHHHAVWRGAVQFGATLHIMTAGVDEGPIVAVEAFDVAPDEPPRRLLERANLAALNLVERTGPLLLAREPMPLLPNAFWGASKTKRADFLRLAHVSPLIGDEEFERRFRAFDGAERNNLTLDLHGKTFRIDKQFPAVVTKAAAFEGFTETAYRGLLRALKEGSYRFAHYGDSANDRHVLWRHDVDVSMHRAVRLAEIEAEQGVLATYFLNPRCVFYNLLEPEIAVLANRLISLGHDIGLHFDAGAFNIAQWDRETLVQALARERQLIETILETPISAVSWHNPDLSNLLEFQDETIGGLVSAYSASLRRDYAYGSDSNGYWRFKSMSALIAEGSPRLHLLTHPEWWTPEPLPPSERIDRAILGRARAVRRDYDALLARGGRRNVT